MQRRFQWNFSFFAFALIRKVVVFFFFFKKTSKLLILEIKFPEFQWGVDINLSLAEWLFFSLMPACPCAECSRKFLLFSNSYSFLKWNIAYERGCFWRSFNFILLFSILCPALEDLLFEYSCFWTLLIGILTAEKSLHVTVNYSIWLRSAGRIIRLLKTHFSRVYSFSWKLEEIHLKLLHEKSCWVGKDAIRYLAKRPHEFDQGQVVRSSPYYSVAIMIYWKLYWAMQLTLGMN